MQLHEAYELKEMYSVDTANRALRCRTRNQ